MKPDELNLLRILWENRNRNDLPRLMVDEGARMVGMPEKRALRLADKWTRQGIWEYGVSPRTGWFTEKFDPAILKVNQ